MSALAESAAAVASLETRPTLWAAKQADDALRRQFASLPFAERVALPATLGLVQLYTPAAIAADAAANRDADVTTRSSDASATASLPLFERKVVSLDEPHLTLLLDKMPKWRRAFKQPKSVVQDRAALQRSWQQLTGGLFTDFDWTHCFAEQISTKGTENSRRAHSKL